MEKEKRICLRERDVKLILFLAEYGSITNENVKLLYESEYYYKNRLASLAKGDMIERLYGKVVLSRKGKRYLNEIGIGYRNINRDENYKKRMERISDIACKVQSCGWYFEPSWKCDVNTYTKRGNRYVGVMSRQEKSWGESFDDFYKRSYMVYFLHKDITPRELKYINKEMDRNKRYFRGIIIFVEDERFLKHPKFIDINIEEIYTILYDASVWKIFEKIKDEDYMKERVLDIFGDEYKKLSNRLFESYYLNQNDVYIYVFPMPFADFAKMEYINFMANRKDCSDAEFKVVCNDICVEYVRKFLDEKVEVCCLEGEEKIQKKLQNLTGLLLKTTFCDIVLLNNCKRRNKMDSSIRSIIDRIWTNFWEGGVTNPLTVIEQITYLLFVKGLDDIEIAHEKNDILLGIKSKRIFDEEHQNCRWSRFKDYPAEKMFKIMSEEVFPFIKNLANDKNSGYAKYMEDAIFIIPTPIMLQKVVTAMDKLEMKDRDTKGDVYEYLLSKLSQAGVNGQFRTPRHIIKMIVELMRPTPEDIIVDPACGTAGFLVDAGEYLRKNKSDLFLSENLTEHFNNTMFYGFDMDRTMLRIGAMNLMQHGIENPNIMYKDSLSEDNEDNGKYTLVLANPPFKGSIDAERTSKDLLAVTKTKKTELLFLALFLRSLKIGGRCASIVPDGVLFGSSNAHKQIRKEIIENHKLEAIISMPSGVFKPYAGVSTAILIFTKTTQGGTDKVWFYDMTADGYSLDDQRQPVKENDIPDIINRFSHRESEEEQNRARTEKSFFVSKEEIVENDYDLSINKYKEIVVEKKEYENPEAILKRVINMEFEIQQKLKELEEML